MLRDAISLPGKPTWWSVTALWAMSSSSLARGWARTSGTWCASKWPGRHPIKWPGPFCGPACAKSSSVWTTPSMAACHCWVSTGRPSWRMAAPTRALSRTRCAWPARRPRQASPLPSPKTSPNFPGKEKREREESGLPDSPLSSLSLFSLPCFPLTFGGSAQFADAAIEIGVVPLFGGVAPFLAHLGEVIRAIFDDIGLPALAGNRAVVFDAAFLFQAGAALFANAAVVVLAVLVANLTAPPAARF